MTNEKRKPGVFERIFPLIGVLRGYNAQAFKGDIAAGFVTAVLLIPQGMAYAMLAGLPPEQGLYASIVPVAVYAFFGSSRQLSVAPVAMVSLLVASALGGMNLAPEDYVHNATLLALIVGVMMILMGLFRVGFLDNFLSRSVLSGFTIAAALIIGLSQLKYLLGIEIGGPHHVLGSIYYLLTHTGQVNWPTMAVGFLSLGVIYGLRKWDQRIPGSLVVVILATFATSKLGLDRLGVDVVGSIPSQLPRLQIPQFDFNNFRILSGYALTIVLVGFVESISVARALAARSRNRINSNRELLAMGISNIAGGLFGGYPVAGGFSRSVVNYDAGARTGVASIICAGVMAVATVFFAPYLYHLPRAVLAVVIMVAVFGLIDPLEVKRTFQVKRQDGYILILTFAATILMGVELGVLLGIFTSVGLFIWNSMHPHIAVLGRLPGSGELYRNVERFDVETSPEYGIIRVDAPLYFANVAFFQEHVLGLVSENPRMKYIVLDASGINDLDSSALETLEALAENLEHNGTRLCIASARGPIRDLFRQGGFYNYLGKGQFFHSVPRAVSGIRRCLETGCDRLEGDFFDEID